MDRENQHSKALNTSRLKRERATIEAMVSIYCTAHHQPAPPLCESCSELLSYAEMRLIHCPFADHKPTCGNCTIHCYKKDMRSQVQEVMRFSGPRMLLRHPILALRHLLDGKRKPPVMPRESQEAKTKTT